MVQAAEEYRTSLEDLTFNSKPHINALTMLAEEYQDEARVIVRVIEEKLDKALPNCKLPIMYLMDSIVKNVGGNYKPLFAQNIVKSFMSTFQEGDDKIKMSLYKLRSTWDNHLPLKRLYELDIAVQAIDSNWPVKPLPASLQEKGSTSIHVNPKFIKCFQGLESKPGSTDSVPASGATSRITSSKTTMGTDSSDLKQDLINKQKQLLELQQQKLLLELEQTKQQLAMREKKTLEKKQGKAIAKDPRIKQASVARPGMRGSVNGGIPEVRDPRVALTSGKSKADVKKAPAEVSRKLGDVKKSGEAKAVEKNMSPSNSEKVEKKKKSPTNTNKTAMAKMSKPPPKSSKSDSIVKKSSSMSKKSTGKAVKRNSPESKLDEPLKSKSIKNKDKTVRRSPPRPHPPPSKQPRQSSSIERRKSPHREMNNAAEHIRGRPFPNKTTDSRRFSPMPGEGSMSPRFSPEPDESPARNNWAPSVKRRRHQNLPPQSLPAHIPLNHEPPRIQRRTSVDPNLTIPQELSLSHQAEIMKQADIQLQTGQLTHTQHQELLKQLHQLFQLQRLRNSVSPGPDIHRMPLDQLLPPHERMSRNDEFRPPIRYQEDLPQNFRPPPSPPMMRDEPRSAHPLRERNLTPPPNPPIDPRRNRERPVDKRPIRDYHDPRSRIRNEPDRRPSPPHRQRNAGWDENKAMQRHDMGTDLGNVYILDDDQESDIPPRHRQPDMHDRDQTIHDLNNDARLSNRVPLQTYTDDNTSHERRPSFDRSNPPDNHDDAINERPVPQGKADSENEYEGLQFEEPEDYIIANIPPGAEAYHEHSMKLKGRNKVSASMIATRKLSDAGKEQELNNEKIDSMEAALMSPDSSRDRSEDVEDLTKSPSLPLKKRKYVVSPGRMEDPDTGIEPEAEAHAKANDPPDISEKTVPDDDSVIREREFKTENETDDSAILESKKSDGDTAEKHNGIKSEVEQKESRTTKEEEKKEKEEKNLDGPKGETAATSSRIKSEKVTRPSGNKRKSAEKEQIRPLLTGPNIEPIKKKRKRDKAKDRKPAQALPKLLRHPPEENIAILEEERRLNQLMMEEEERLRWEAQLEMELGREEFQERERIGRVRRGSPPRMMWPRDDGPWRGRGGRPPMGRARRFERGFWDNEPPPRFAERLPPPNRPPPPPRRLIDEREWNRREERLDRPPMLRPPPGREWPPRGPPRGPSPTRLLPPERPQPPADLNQVNVNKLLSDLLSMGIIPGQGKTNEAEKSAEPPAVTKSSQEDPDVHQIDPVNVPPSLAKNEKKLDENRVPTPVFDDLLTIDPNANLPDFGLRDMEKLKIRNEDVIARLYTGIQCSACGMRFTACQTDMYAEHLDWHYRLNRKDKEGVRETHRELYPTAGEWIMYEEIADPSRREKSQVFDGEEDEVEEEPANEATDENELAVPVAKNPEQDKCAVCNEAFTTIYNDEEEEWQYINCVAVDGKNFHPACYADHNDPDDETAPPPPTPVRVPIYNPLSVAASGIPGLDSLSKELTDNDVTNDHEMEESEAGATSPAIDSKQEIDGDAAIDGELPAELEDPQLQTLDTDHAAPVENCDKGVDNEEKPTSNSDNNQNSPVVEMKPVEEDFKAQDVDEKNPIPLLDNSTADDGIKSVDPPNTQILDQVESHSPLTSAVDNDNEVSLVSNNVDDAPVDDNDSVSLQVVSSSSLGAVGGDNCFEASRDDAGSEVGCSTGEQEQEPRAPESEVDDVPAAVDAMGDSSKAEAVM